jgi:hypothetical protein
MAFDGKFEMFECDMATTRRGNLRYKLFGQLTNARNPGLPSASDDDSLPGEELHGAEEVGGPCSVRLNTFRDGIICRRERDLDDCAEIAQKFPVWRLRDDRAASAEDSRVSGGEQAMEDLLSDAMATFGGLKRIAHPAEMQGHAASKELSKNTRSPTGERVVDAAEHGERVRGADSILRRIASSVSGEAVCTAEATPAVGVEAKRKAAERELARKRQWSGIACRLTHFALPRFALPGLGFVGEGGKRRSISSTRRRNDAASSLASFSARSIAALLSAAAGSCWKVKRE